MNDSSKDAAKKDPALESNSMLLTITGPFLNFLAAHNERKLENSDKLEALKTNVFWPFAIAGGFLLGLGIAGGHAFMSGKIDKQAIEAAEVSNPRDGRRGLRRELAGDKPKPSQVGGGVVEATISPEARRGALRTASAALGLGTLLACTGAAATVKFTFWYLKVDTVEEFAGHVRSHLPESMQRFSKNSGISEKREAFSTWFRDSSGVGAWMDRQEKERRERAALAAALHMEKSGAMTAMEKAEESERLANEALVASGPVAQARSLVRRTTGL